MADTYGLSSVTWGVPTLTGYVVQSYDLSKTNQVVAEIFNESGIRKHARYDDLTSEISIEVVFDGATLPVPGAVLTYNGVKYEVLSLDEKASNKDFKKFTIKGKTSAGLTLP